MTKEMRATKVLAAGANTPRTLGDQFGDIINVKSNGAVGNGIADDTAAIQGAMDVAFGPSEGPVIHGDSNWRLNKPVYFPAGIYKVTSPLHCTGVLNGWIFGDGSSSTTIKYEGPLPTVLPEMHCVRTGNVITSIVVDVNGAGFPPGQFYRLGFDTVGQVSNSNNPMAYVIANPDGTVTQASVTLDCGSEYTSTPSVAIGATTPLFRSNGMTKTLFQGILFDMPAETFPAGSADTCCVMMDKWTDVEDQGNNFLCTFEDIATKNATYGFLLGFSGDTGTQYHSVSTSSVTIGTGSKTFTATTASGGPVVGKRVRATAVSDPNSWLEGQLTSVTPSIVINSDKTSGSGTFSNWKIDTSKYTGFNAQGSEMLFVGCTCTDHSMAGIRTSNANVLSENVYQSTFIRCGRTPVPEDPYRSAALQAFSGTIPYVDGCTFIDSPNFDYIAGGTDGISFFNNTIINNIATDGGAPNHGPSIARFVGATVCRNLKHTNIALGGGTKRIIFHIYQLGCIFDGCKVGHGILDNRGSVVYSRSSTFLDSDPFLLNPIFGGINSAPENF